MQPQVNISEYTRQNPSPRYRQLLEQYQHMHQHGGNGIAPEAMFAGVSLPPQAQRVAALIKRTGAANLLDYGCGKAILYSGKAQIKLGERAFPSIQAFWGINNITLYDPAYSPYTQLPQGTFDGVISTDVLEHCPQEDVPWILAEMFAYAKLFLFATIACYPAKKTLPNGENAHCTVQPITWWKGHIDRLAAQHPTLQYQFIIIEQVQSGGELKKKESVIERVARR